MQKQATKRILLTLWIQIGALTIALLSPATSQGVSFNSAPATVWGTLYAAEDSNRTFFATEGDTPVATTRTGDLGLPRERRSTFEITYSNVPDRAKDAIDLGNPRSPARVVATGVSPSVAKKVRFESSAA